MHIKFAKTFEDYEPVSLFHSTFCQKGKYSVEESKNNLLIDEIMQEPEEKRLKLRFLRIEIPEQATAAKILKPEFFSRIQVKTCLRIDIENDGD